MKIFTLIPVLSLVFFSNCSGVKESISSESNKEIIDAMNKAADDWNKGNLDAFMALYDSGSTFMLPNGPVGIGGMKENYQKGFFNGNMPKQNLSYDEMVVRGLGKNYALLTGKFILAGNNLKERTGRYTLVFVKRKEGWKILHDHSS